VQTFLPYPSFQDSARCLDWRRLGKQRVEAMLILFIIRGEGWQSWKSHPAVKMWRGYEAELVRYGVVVCDEWIARGYRDTTRPRLLDMMPTSDRGAPPWLGDPRLHSSHRSNLLRKDLDYYSRFGWAEPPDLPYFWPVR